MKKTYFIIFLGFIILGLIFSFENIASHGQVLFLFKTTNQSLFYTIIFAIFIGLLAGFFLGLSVAIKRKGLLGGGSTAENSDIDL